MTATRQLARYIASASPDEIPADVRHEARRALVDYLGCALGGARDEAVERAIETFGPYSGPPNAAVIGRAERMDALHASLINGISSHVEDYDDATPKNYIHATSPIASAMFSYASANPVSGTEFLTAFIVGFEATSRIGNCVHPAHYDAGWHISGTAGTFGAAAAISRLLGLDEQRMIWAIGLAATQAAGIREMFGSMTKSFHIGRAAQNGYTAALLARGGFTAGQHGIEGPRGFAAVLSDRYDLDKITERLGQDFNLRDNTYKPYPCGLVNHSTIDACIQIRRESPLAIEPIRSIRLRVAPLVLELCNKKNASTGLESKFSIYHCAAIALVRGKAGLAEFTDAAVNDPTTRTLCEKVLATADVSLAATGGASVEIELVDGTKLEKFVERSLGSVDRPLSDTELNQKFLEQADGILNAEQARELCQLCWRIDELDDIAPLIRLATAAVP